MKAPVLALRLSRRAIGATVLTDERLTFIDGRHLRSTRTATRVCAERYFCHLFDQVRPATVLVDSPHNPGSQAEEVATTLRRLADERSCAIRAVTTGQLLEAFGSPALPTRTTLRDVAEPLFGQDLAMVTGAVRPFVVEAAALALLGEAINGFPSASDSDDTAGANETASGTGREPQAAGAPSE